MYRLRIETWKCATKCLEMYRIRIRSLQSLCGFVHFKAPCGLFLSFASFALWGRAEKRCYIDTFRATLWQSEGLPRVVHAFRAVLWRLAFCGSRRIFVCVVYNLSFPAVKRRVVEPEAIEDLSNDLVFHVFDGFRLVIVGHHGRQDIHTGKFGKRGQIA